jgi:hypothetical protein
MYVIKVKDKDLFLHIYKETDYAKTKSLSGENTGKLRDLQEVRTYPKKASCSNSLNYYLSNCQKQSTLDINSIPFFKKEDLQIVEVELKIK